MVIIIHSLFIIIATVPPSFPSRNGHGVLVNRAIRNIGSSHQPSAVNHQPSTINHQPSTISRQPSTVNRQPSYLCTSIIRPRSLLQHPRRPRATQRCPRCLKHMGMRAVSRTANHQPRNDHSHYSTRS
ncbi:hypothetical protein K504DRAFT_186895 [Pleomassaria siparia CBS 279.74]|uniref:Secreted protein n=1 Tax=Pleomassaria siparia CBS 279.74 TaxID=1314801 RepID=A0A6G1JRT4_9PLEO|nr:hypothetical protein K504DRAFT_186895 [Pleomassaria siparia CBS 279.74]